MMKQPTHHLTDPLLTAYAAGTLPEAFSLVVATHVSLCDDCRAQLAALESVGGALLDDVDAVALDAGALAATLDRIAAQDSARPAPAPRVKGVFPEPLRAYVGGDFDTVRWRPVGGGVKQAILKTEGGATARLLRIPGGVSVPDHSHGGTELTLVLQGAFRDETARFGRGDVEVADQDLTHTPIAEEGEVCICLAATDAPLRFKGLLPRIAQRFVRI